MQTKTVNNKNTTRNTKRFIVLLLAITVILGVFWWLKLVGLTMAGEAFCGMDEHVHTDECLAEGCTRQEHTHVESCYSNLEADLESTTDWDESVAGVKLTGVLSDDIVAIAKSQLGYTESVLNFILDDDGNRLGYNRYGAWHGNPYGNWSAMFASFCLYYSDITEDMVPYNSGVDAMRLEWEKNGLYTAYDGAAPNKGDLVFLDKDKNGSADAVAVVETVNEGRFTVIEGDLDNKVSQAEYNVDDSVMGYGLMTQVERKTVDADRLNFIDSVISMIDQLPTADEALDALTALEEDMDAYEEYYLDILNRCSLSNMLYMDVEKGWQHLVTNHPKLSELMMAFPKPTTYALEVGQTGAYTIYQINNMMWIGWQYPMLISGQSIDAYLTAAYNQDPSSNAWVASFNFQSWICYQIEYNSTTEMYYVAAIHGESVNKRTLYNTTSKGYMFLACPQYTNENGETRGTVILDSIKKGDSVVAKNASGNVYSSFPTSAGATNAGNYTPVAGGLGSLTFGTTAKESVVDNSDYLKGTVPTPDTTNFIDINLFNYGGDPNGQYINSLWKQDVANGVLYPRPGYQRPAPLNTTTFTNVPNRYCFGLGDMVVADLNLSYDNVCGSGVNPKGINKLYTGYEASRATEGVMYPVLKDGNPALINGTDLGYLFNDGSATGLSYIEKQNTQNITGLFQYDAENQLYYFDSRNNHAQWDAASNKFLIYEDIITPSFIMYPFGNFMPFNDIVTQSTPILPKTYTKPDGTTATSASCNLNYIRRTAASAMSLYNQTGLSCYKNLAEVMEEMYDNISGNISGVTPFLSGVSDVGYGGVQHLSYQLLNYYSGKITSSSDASYKLFEKVVAQNGYADMYSIDFDEQSDFYFGMDIHFDFAQPIGGVAGKNNDDMTFNFTGDDDVWVYLDGVLFLDLSGIHSHVGGTINFKEGKVYYYGLGDFAGAVESTPYKVLTFAEILAAAGRDTSVLVNGSFADESVHSLDFYYMERGSGSSMCSINFNLNAIPKNHIEISKELNGATAAIGNPDYLFQVVDYDAGVSDTDSNALIVGANVSYSVYQTDGLTYIEDRVTDANGIIRLKAGETAMIGGIDAGTQFFVRELFPQELSNQYGPTQITIAQNSTSTVNQSITVGGKVYTAVESSPAEVGTVSGEYEEPVNLALGGKYWVTNGYNNEGRFSDVDNGNGGTNLPIYSISGNLHSGKFNDGIINLGDAGITGKTDTVELSRGQPFNGETSLNATAGNIGVVYDSMGGKIISAVNVLASFRETVQYYRGYPTKIVVKAYVKDVGYVTLAETDKFVWYNNDSHTRMYTVTFEPTTTSDLLVQLYMDAPQQTSGTPSSPSSGVIGITEIQVIGGENTVTRDDLVEVGVVNTTENIYSALEIHKELNDYNGAIRDFTFDLSFDGVPVAVGTPYQLYNSDGTLVSDSYTVTTEGKVSFSSDKYVKFNNILAGTDISLKEEASTVYTPGYSFSCQNNNPSTYSQWSAGNSQTLTLSDDTVMGEAAISTNHIVTVTNSVDPIKVTLNGSKTLLNPDGNDHTYNIKLTQVQLADGVYVPMTGGVTMSKQVTVNGADAVPISFELTFSSSWDISVPAYFLIEEEGSGTIAGYDTDHYLFTVTFTVDSDTGKVTATPKLMLNGQGNDVGTFSFENSLVGVLSVSKVVENVEGSTLPFEFTVTVRDGTTPLTGTYTCTDSKGVISSLTFTNGKASLNLSHGQTVTIQNLPLGATWTVTETAASGFQTAYIIADGEERVNGLAANGEVTNTSGVTFYNVAGYELPSTHGSLVRRLLPYIGIAVMLLAFGGACLVRYKRKKNI